MKCPCFHSFLTYHVTNYVQRCSFFFLNLSLGMLAVLKKFVNFLQVLGHTRTSVHCFDCSHGLGARYISSDTANKTAV